MSRSTGHWAMALILAALVLAPGCQKDEPSSQPVIPTDEAEAARMLIAWSLTGKHPNVDAAGSLPGFVGDEPTRVVLYCDFVDADQVLTTDPRVRRIGYQELASMKWPYEVECLRLTLESKKADVLTILVRCSSRGGKTFEVRRTNFGLRAKALPGALTECHFSK